jgi:cytochrome c oxidase subunit II
MPVWVRNVLLLCTTWPLAGCSGRQSALDPQGLQSDEIRFTLFIFLAVAVVWVGVVLVLAVGMLREKRATETPLDLHEGFERRAGRLILGLGAVTTLIVLGLSFVSYAGQRTVFAKDEHALTLKIIGHQWWWEVRYEDAQPSRILTTANEIHIPAGEPVRIILTSTDVIHSFWVPSLAGKIDLIPGHQNVIELKADKPGIYRGQCAEFCGQQHANMSTLVIADPPPVFEAWLNDQLRAAAAPASAEAKAGAEVFLNRPCVMCHRIGGTAAGGTVAPDLTHIASRHTLAAGTLTMSRGNLAAWIADPQGIKPGVHMPVVDLDGNELNAIVAYLEELK